MKKTAIVLILALLLTGCGGVEKTPEPSPSPAPTAAPTPAPTVAPTPTATPTPSPTPEPEGYADLAGRWEGRTYINEVLGLRCRQPETWRRLEEDELSELAALAAGQTGAEQAGQIAAAADSGALRFLLYMAAPDGTRSCQMTAETLEAEAAGKLTAEEYLEAAASEAEQALAAAGAEEVTLERTAVVMAEAVRPALRADFTLSGTPVSELIVAFIEGRYAVCVTFAAPDREAADELLTAWTPILPEEEIPEE